MREFFIWLAKFITVTFVILIVVPAIIIAVITTAEDTVDPSRKIAKDRRVSVLELEGVITNAGEFLRDLHKQVNNDKIKGIVVRIDSPGGAVAPSQEIYSAIRALKSKKPIVVSMGSVAASGGLYASLGASRVICSPGTITGSIGVILQIPNFTNIADKIGFQMVTVKAGALKDVGNSFRPMSPEEEAFLQDTIRVSHKDFMQAVADGRGIPFEQVEQFADGRIILGTQAKELKLVDDFGDVYDAGRVVFDILGDPLPEGEFPEMVFQHDKFEEIRQLIEGISNLPSLFSGAPKLSYLMY